MKKKSLWKKIVLGIVLVLIVVILGLGITIAALWHNEISSVLSIKMLVDENEENRSAPVYQMDVSGDYYFDEFIEQGGASDDNELINFIVKNITRALFPLA